MITRMVRDFLRLESASGILLVIAALLAMIVENSAAKPLYDALLNTPVEIRVGKLHLAKPLLLWVNDGLMAIFFFAIGLEIKREILEGELSDLSRAALPLIAAVGGMLMPAFIFVTINWGDAVALKGWAIPSATDIAFALGILSLLGRHVPASLKLFLLTLAITDDIGSIIIIALFYSSELSPTSMIIAATLLGVLFTLNRKGVTNIAPYLLFGVVLWIAVLKSGVHATLAGLLLAFFIPLRVSGTNEPPLRRLEKDLYPTIAYGILPLFAFANSGLSFDGLSLFSLLEPVPLGIAMGLFLGNQTGIMLCVWITVKSGFARLPEGAGWLEMYGISLLCGIGFTMSLFISSLAFEQGGPDFAVDDRLGILTGSILSALSGYFVLRYALLRKRHTRPIQKPASE